MGKLGSNKVIPGGERTLILKVLRFFEEEKRNGGPILPVNKVLKRTCAATGVSMATVTRIKREEKKILEELAATRTASTEEAPSALKPTPSGTTIVIPATIDTIMTLTTTPLITTTKATSKTDTTYTPKHVVTLPTPGKNRYRPAHNKVEVDDFTIGALRDIINRLHTNDEVPSLTKILAAAQEELNFPGKRETLRKILKERLGYTGHAFKKCDKSNLFVDIVRPEIAALNSLVEIEAHMMHVSSMYGTVNKEHQLGFKEDQFNSKEDQLSLKEDNLSFKEDQLSFKEDQLSFKEDQLSFKEDQLSFNEDQLSFKEDRLKLKEDQLSFQEDKLSFNEDYQVTFKEENPQRMIDKNSGIDLVSDYFSP